MDLGIKNKRVLITGGSNGIGEELAYQFAKEGCKITLIARREKKLKNIIKKIGGKKKDIIFMSLIYYRLVILLKLAIKYLRKLGLTKL